jgi:hypothetical protein
VQRKSCCPSGCFNRATFSGSCKAYPETKSNGYRNADGNGILCADYNAVIIAIANAVIIVIAITNPTANGYSTAYATTNGYSIAAASAATNGYSSTSAANATTADAPSDRRAVQRRVRRCSHQQRHRHLAARIRVDRRRPRA